MTYFIPAPRHNKVIQLLSSRAPSRLTAREIHAAVGGSWQVLNKDLRELRDAKILRSFASGRRNERLYCLYDQAEETQQQLPRPVTISTDFLLRQLQRFAESGQYQTTVQKLAWKVPQAIAKLYEAALAQAVGTKVTPAYLSEILKPLEELNQAASQLNSFTHAMLTDARLKDPAQLQLTLFGSGEVPVELIQKLTEQALDNWTERD